MSPTEKELDHCKFCNRRVQSNIVLKAHESIHTREMSCADTNTFDHLSPCMSHAIIQFGENPCICNVCSKPFKGKEDLKVHERIHTGDKPYLCTVCGRTFHEKSAFKRHDRIHTDQRPYLCNVCGKAFKGYKAYKRHENTHVGGKIEKRFDEKSNFISHIGEILANCNACHAVCDEIERHQCKICDKILQSDTALKAHESIHLRKGPYICKVCCKVFDYLSLLKVHVRSHTGEKPYKCNVCSKHFSRIGHLQDHTKIHTGEKAYKCVDCSKTFHRKSDLKMHETIHTGERPYLCNICGKTFRAERMYKNHHSIHDGEKPHVSKCSIQMCFAENDKWVVPTVELLNNCNSCDGSLEERDLLLGLNSIPRGDKLHQIKISGRMSQSEDSRERHHTGGKLYVCKECDKAFVQQSNLKKHERIHSLERPFACAVCGKHFRRLSHLQDHEKIHTGVRPYKCTVCSKAFHRKSYLKAHERSHTGELPYFCNICGVRFNDKRNYELHARIHAGETPNVYKDVTEKSFEENSNCVVPAVIRLDNYSASDRGFEDMDLLVRQKSIATGNDLHQSKINGSLEVIERYHTGKKSYICRVCDKAFGQRSNLRNHERIHTGERPFVCTVCDKHFSRLGHLQDHEKIHTGVKPYSCIACSKAFNRKSSLKVHERIHTGERPYYCNICDKGFNEKKTYNQHAKIHAGESPDVCLDLIEKRFEESNLALPSGNKPDSYNSCYESFKDRDPLVGLETNPTGGQMHQYKRSSQLSQSKDCSKVHEPYHTGEKRYVCNVCNKGFAQQCNLKKHERIHSGERPYQCIECGQRFRRLYHLQDHAKIHTGLKPYKCKVCSKAFQRNSDLKVHERVHTGERPFICYVCSKAFKDKRAFKRHEGIHTGKISSVNKVCRDDTGNLCHNSGEKPYVDLQHKVRSKLKVSKRICTKNRSHLFRGFTSTFVHMQNNHQPSKEIFLKNKDKMCFSDKPFGCGFCNEMFVLETDFLKHCNTHDIITYCLIA